MIVWVGRPAGRAHGEKNRHLTDIAWPSDGKPSGGIEFTSQYVGDGISALRAKEPGGDDGPRLLDDRRDDQRPARGNQRDDRFAEIE